MRNRCGMRKSSPTSVCSSRSLFFALSRLRIEQVLSATKIVYKYEHIRAPLLLMSLSCYVRKRNIVHRVPGWTASFSCLCKRHHSSECRKPSLTVEAASLCLPLYLSLSCRVIVRSSQEYTRMRLGSSKKTYQYNDINYPQMR